MHSEEHQFNPVSLAIVLALGLLVAVVLLGVLFSFSPLTQLTLLAASLSGVFLVAMPAVGLLVITAMRILIEVFWWVPVHVGSLDFAELSSGALALVVGILWILAYRRLKDHPCLPAFAVYSLFLVGAFLHPVTWRIGSELLVTYLSPFLLFFLMYAYLRTEWQIRSVLVVTTLAGIIPVAFSLRSLLTGENSINLGSIDRILGGYRVLHSHAHAMMLFTTLGIFWFIRSRSSVVKFASALYAAIAFTALYFTYVRTAMVDLVVVVPLLLLLQRRYVLLGLLALGATMWFLSNGLLQHRYGDIGQIFLHDPMDVDYGDLGSGRVGIWSASITSFFQKPVWLQFFGLGLGQHYALDLQHFNFIKLGGENPYGLDTHSDYMAMLLQMGPASLLAYIAMQLQVIRYSWKVRTHATAAPERYLADFVLALSAAPIISNSISNSFVTRISIAWFYWGTAGLIFAAWHLIEQRRLLASPTPSVALAPPGQVLTSPDPDATPVQVLATPAPDVTPVD
jgi:hypothetical protein